MLDQQIINEIQKSITILNEHSGDLTTGLAVLQERVDWLCKFFWIVVTASIGGLIANVYQIFLMRKNNKK